MSSIPLSPHRALGDLVFTSGQVGLEADGTVGTGFARQAELAMDALKACLEEAGAALETVLKVTVFLVDDGDFEQMNEIYRRYFAEPFPARTTIVTRLAVPDFVFEIEAVAARVGC